MPSLIESKKDFCLLNYYAIELLMSAGNTKPTQKEIDLVEDRLKNIKTDDLSERLFSTLIHKKRGKGRVLLIENDQILFAAHYILLSNFGFTVDFAKTIEQVILKSSNQYEAVFARPDSVGLNSWMSAMIFHALPKNRRPKIYLFMKQNEEESMCKAFLDRGVSAIFEIPLSIYTLESIL